MMIHTFQQSVEGIEQPRLFTYPFRYTPHPLCLRAAEEVQAYLTTRTDWQDELQRGKMFGVLVVETPEHGLGFLAAFSGILAGNNQHPYFVPPIYDLLQPEGFFRIEEENISALNREVKRLQEAPEWQLLQQSYRELKATADRELQEAKAAYKAAKREREERRSAAAPLTEAEREANVPHPPLTEAEREASILHTPLTEAEREAMIRESQFQKAELKRLERRWKARLDEQQAQVEAYQARLTALKQERKQRSSALQLRLFEQFRLKNARGETIDLCALFQQAVGKEPPAGAGECAAPKLLQYAYLHRLRPVCMAEFWWGDSPKQEIRHHGCYYPACQSKCGPILGFMLQGLPVEPNPLAEDSHRDTPLETVYEDDDLCVVNKPAGLLSVPGKEAVDSVYRRMRLRYPEATGPLVVHRLDMDTSGLLVIAKRMEVYHHLQQQFTGRTVEKRYVALLDGLPAAPKGEIRLPLRPDLDDRPRQRVDFEQGKEAVTRYEVLETRESRSTAKNTPATNDSPTNTTATNTTATNDSLRNEEGQPSEARRLQTLVAFYPLTGRTHQLRVHAAHPEGLHCPIHGDALYGQPADRLYLHAESLKFIHPTTGQEIALQQKADFE